MKWENAGYPAFKKNKTNALYSKIKDFITICEEVYKQYIKMHEIAKYEVVKRV